MASDRQQFREATSKWESLLRAKQLSVSPAIGITAIMFAEHTIGNNDCERQLERDSFENEAYDLADEMKSSNQRVNVIRGITRQALYGDVLSRSEVASVVLIGHGNFSNVFCDQGGFIDWRDISYISSHLKQGYFEQRFCGNYMRNLSVPLGMFALSDARNIYAPKGLAFAPEVHPTDEQLIQRITDKRQLRYTDIKTNFPLDKAYKEAIDSQRSTVDPTEQT